MRKRKAVTLISASKISPSEHSEQGWVYQLVSSQVSTGFDIRNSEWRKEIDQRCQASEDGGRGSRCARFICPSLEFMD